MTEYAGRGDPARSLALLWGLAEEPSRGPRQGLSVGEVVEAAVALADAGGLEAVSMRKVAARLDVSAMSLYTYVPGKRELLDLMLDHCLAELVAEPIAGGRWRDRMATLARSWLAFHRRHPWVLAVSASRPLLGPNETAVFERCLEIVDGLGLPGPRMARLVEVVASFVRGAAHAVVDAEAAEGATGLSDDDWWTARAPLLEELVVDWAGRFPTVTRVGREQAFDPVADPAWPTDVAYTVGQALATFEVGLDLMLDGIEGFVAAHGSEEGHTPGGRSSSTG